MDINEILRRMWVDIPVGQITWQQARILMTSRALIRHHKESQSRQDNSTIDALTRQPEELIEDLNVM